MFISSIFCSNSQVYVIDFGLAKRYRDSTTNRHIPYRSANDVETYFFLNYQIFSFFFQFG